LYQIFPFYFIKKISRLNGEIYSINSFFVVNNIYDKMIECYDINGNLIHKKYLANVLDEDNHAFGYFNNKFIIGTRKTKKLIRL
jgi:hypothetical protein